MTKRNVLLVSLLLVFGLGVMAPAALAQAPTEGYGTIINVAPSLYTLRPNSIGDAVGPVFLNFSSGYGTIAGGEVFNVTYSQPIVGASGINSLGTTVAAADFCDDSHATGIAGTFCSAMTYTASGNTLTLTNGTAPIGGWTAGYITIWGVRVSTVGVLPGFVTATVNAALNQSYPISFSTQGATTAVPVNVGQIANTTSGGTVTATSVPINVLTCIGTSGVSADFTVTVTEQWAGAWTALSDELVLAPYAPTATNKVTNGSEISIEVSGIPNGATITPEAITKVSGSQTWAALPAAYTGTVPNDHTTFDFVLTTTLRQEVEASTFTFKVVTVGAVPANTPSMTASVTLNPMTPTTAAEYPAFTYPVGTLAEEPTYPLPALSFIGCQTNLLFPYVTNYTGGGTSAEANWDTAIGVSNTTSDPFNYSSPDDGTPVPSGATPQDGSCTFYIYGAGTASAPRATPTTATPIIFTTPVVLSGGNYSFFLSWTKAAGFLGGYAIAVCNFQNAVGYEETVDNAGIGNWEVMGSYLAYVIPNPYYEPRSYDAILGEFSIWNWFGLSYDPGAVGAARGSQSRKLHR